jgi:hypothetical protein
VGQTALLRSPFSNMACEPATESMEVRSMAALPNAWTPIAERSRETEKLLWRELTGAPLSVDDARRMSSAGNLLMACRHHLDRVELVVRPTRLGLQAAEADV